MCGWIKLHRSLKDWEWYDDHNATRLLVHLLLTVNYEPKKWKGFEVKPGTIVCSWETLASNSGLSVAQTRTAMEKLEDSREVTRKVTNRFQFITLVKWDELQSEDTKDSRQIASRITDKSQADNKQIATTKEREEYKEGKKKEYIGESKPSVFSFKKSLIELGAKETLVDDFLKVRKTKKNANTVTALDRFLKQVKKSGKPLNDILELCCEKSWAGFNAEWIKTEEPKQEKLVYVHNKPTTKASFNVNNL